MTKQIFLSGVHSAGKTTVIREVARVLQKSGLSIYAIPEMSFPFDVPIGTPQFQIKYKHELMMRRRIIQFISEMKYFDYILCDRDYLDTIPYDINISNIDGDGVTDKILDMLNEVREDAVYIVLYSDFKEEVVKNRAEEQSHRKDWNEADVNYYNSIQEYFMEFYDFASVDFDNVYLVENRYGKLDETVNAVLSIILGELR